MTKSTWRLSVCSFLNRPVTSSLSGPKAVLSTTFSNNLRLRSFVNVRDQVSHPYKTTGNIFLLTLILMGLHSKWEGKIFWTNYRSTAQVVVPEKKTETATLFFFYKTLISNSEQILFAVLEFIQPTDTQTVYTRGCESLAGTQENGNVRYGTEKLNNSSPLSTWTSGFKESAIASGIVRGPVFRTPKCSLCRN
jgi:hypothetical protein